MSNYQRFNTFVSEYENKIDEESNSTNDERLQKSLAENANEYVRRSELGSGLLSAAQATYQGREYIQKAKGTYDSLKKLPKTLEEKVNRFKGEAKKFKGDVEEGISDAKDAVNALPKSISEAKGSLESAVQSAKETVQGKIQDVKDILNNGVQDAQDGVQDGIASTRRVAPDMLSGDPEDLLSGSRRSPDAPNFTSRDADTRQPTGRSQANPGEPQEQEMQEIKPSGETAKINEQISTAAKETEKGAKEAGNVAGEIGKAGEAGAATGEEVGGLAAGEEALGEGTAAAEAATGGVFSEVVLPVAAASMVGFAIYDLFKNKPKESIIAPKNPLFVPPKFTQQKEALSTTSSLPE
jgi:hypothetical protein